MRAVVTGIAVLVVAGTAIAAAIAPTRAQVGYDRPGGDYAGAPIPNGDPAMCAARCERDKRCRSWSFSYPSAAGEPAMCHLKHDVMPRITATCCVSGVRGGAVVEPQLGDNEYSIDRVGGDYRSFDTTPEPHGKPCAAACQADKNCRAWTYRRPGYGTATARCYLKEAIKPPRHRPCCISGVVR